MEEKLRNRLYEIYSIERSNGAKGTFDFKPNFNYDGVGLNG